ncbi:ribonuclease R [Anaerococcus lactolyticus ATCC 51172]|uniref:Ribonuclease R n=1 Tax=Anaerococcus lactolyticus ATCC 51172 TaxID=525254 RepID=C2BDL4_9FIRM|nr:ribonuclease R [Anaerococcus lactolyticus]EEI87043.1 ribonuclease R [Anaerococcus lactolyticus ATCC 51172]
MNIKDLILNLIYDGDYIPMTLKELELYLKADKYTKAAVKDIIDELIKDNKIRISNKKRILPLTEEELNLIGKISIASGGYGFFISNNRNFDDVYISKDKLNNAHNNDKVRIRIIRQKEKSKNAEGEVVEILEKANEELIGTYQANKNFGFVICDEKSQHEDIYVNKENSLGAKNGDKVVVEIITYPKSGNPEGKIIEIIGGKNDKNIDILSIVRQKKIPTDFSKQTKKELVFIEDQVNQNELEGRTDLTKLFTVTIDGRDSKDFDDAISIEINGEDYDLYVHIADVSHYVKKHTALDDDAYERGNSTYLYNIVIPMLPEKLSNGICSLNPGEIRLSLTAKMTIDKKGKVIDNNFYKAYIKSDKRLVYDDVNDFLEGDKDVFDDSVLKEKLGLFDELYKILKKSRENRGSIDFNFEESQIDVSETGEVLNIEALERGPGNKMIEEFMLIANETVASLFAYMDFPFIYRIHEKPSEEKLDGFKRALNAMGYNIKGNDLHPKDFQNILKEVEGKKEEKIINMLMLRTMKKARYANYNDIHFGLSTKFYTHFTAPIRRYPDLIVHRILKFFIENKLNKINQTSLESNLEEAADHLSITERRSEDAERAVEDLMKCKYMTRFIGEVFEGRISSITEFGMFIELENTVEGLFMYKFSDHRYDFIEDSLRAFDVDTKIYYNIGQEVKIRVVNVDLVKREIDFYLEDEDEIISQ